MELNFSPTYYKLIDVLFKTKAKIRTLKKNKMDNTTFIREETEETSLFVAGQDFYMSVSQLWSMCTKSEWHLLGKIGSELKFHCALWHCPSELKSTNSSVKIAIKGLRDKRILIKTETPDVYLVNPNFLRRGDTLSVLYTTASIIQDVKKVLPEHIQNYQPVTEYTPLFSEEEVSKLLLSSSSDK